MFSFSSVLKVLKLCKELKLERETGVVCGVVCGVCVCVYVCVCMCVCVCLCVSVMSKSF